MHLLSGLLNKPFIKAIKTILNPFSKLSKILNLMLTTSALKLKSTQLKMRNYNFGIISK